MNSFIFEISSEKTSNIVYTLVGLTIVSLLTSLYFVNNETYIWLAQEDSLGENLTALLYALSGILLLMASYNNVCKGQKVFAQTLTVLLGLFFIFIACEEISWGQRIFNFKTPEFMGNKNLQGELNLHNLPLFDKNAYILNQHTALNIFTLINGVILPIIYLFHNLGKSLLDKINYPIIPISCVAFFFLGLVHGMTIAKLYPHWAHSEIKELIFSIGFLLFGISLFRDKNRPFNV